MKLMAIWSNKGGVGKSTLTTLAALEYARRGERVCVIDGDFPQHSIKAYQEFTKDKSFGLHLYDGGSLETFIERFTKGYNRVLIDFPPRATLYARQLIATDDIKIIVPVVSGDFDNLALKQLIELRDAAHENGVDKFTLATFLNKAEPAIGSKTNKETRQLLDDVALNRMKSELTRRTAYGKITSGRTLKQIDGKANNEFLRLLDEIEKL